MIVDTNAVSAMLNGDRKLRRVLRSANVVAVPAIVVGEFRFGLVGSRDEASMSESFGRFIAGSVLLVVDADTADHYAAIRHELQQAGTPIPANDLGIAALARQHRLPILSRDAHFGAVAGVKRIDW